MRKIIIILAAAMLFGACADPGYLPVVVNANTEKGLGDKSEYDYRPIEMVCYIDTSRYNPLNVLDYTITADAQAEINGKQFFDYVVLGRAVIQQDPAGIYFLQLSDDLAQVLSRRHTLIRPLQSRGIKVLLGLESAGGSSFGNLSEDEMNIFSQIIFDNLQTYNLDGFELYDNARAEAYPTLADFDPNEDYTSFEYKDWEIPQFDPQNQKGWTEQEWYENYWLLAQWKTGANSLNNFYYTIRYKYNADIRDDYAFFLREKNYGTYLPEAVGCTSGMADFASSGSQITYSFNDNPVQFLAKSYQRNTYEAGDNPWSNEACWLRTNQFGPLKIDMTGDSGGSIDRYLSGGDNSYIQQFIAGNSDGKYQAIYFENLKPVSAVASDDAYYGGMSANDVFDRIIKEIFGTDHSVVCSNGDHQADWL